MCGYKKQESISRLLPNREIVGTLHAVKEEDSCRKLQFTCIKEIELSPDALPIDKLLSLIGKRIGIFNLDGRFYVRQIKEGGDND